MPRLCDQTHCTGCTACFSVCPKHAIQMKYDSEGFLYPVVDENLCVSCNLCEISCPVLNHPPQNTYQTKAYAAICTREEIRQQSTSGGVFTLLAEWIFDRGGVVFGAEYNEDFSVSHCVITQEDNLQKLRTAKYAQSTLDDTFAKVQEELKSGKYVLFSGTPCQVSGLQAYLKKPCERLITVDVVCHGVPSPKVWQHYIDYRREHDAPGCKIDTINLRSKVTGWPGYSVCFSYRNGTCYSAKNNEDPFLRGFVGDYYLRPSCYECDFKGISRNSDFTLADYWGVWSQLPEYNDGKGTSLVLLHSSIAQQIWSQIQTDLRCQELDPLKAVEENPSALRASRKPQNREDFWDRYETEDFTALITELIPSPAPLKQPTLLRRALRKFRQIVEGK